MVVEPVFSAQIFSTVLDAPRRAFDGYGPEAHIQTKFIEQSDKLQVGDPNKATQVLI